MSPPTEVFDMQPARVGSASTEALLRIMSQRGWYLVVTDHQMWEACFVEWGDLPWGKFIWAKSCSLDEAILLAAATVLDVEWEIS